MKEKIVKKEIQIPSIVDTKVYEANDGIQFDNPEDAEYHEKVELIPKQNIKSEIINNEYLTQYIGNFKFVYFKDEKEIEAYEQAMCNGDYKTWGSWVSCKEKFKFPCWIMCYYVVHKLCNEFPDNSYTAIYMTPEEVKNDLNDVIKQINKLK